MAAVESGGQEHGALVQQILETQKELQDGNKRERVEIEREAAVRFCLILLVLLTTVLPGGGGRSSERQGDDTEGGGQAEREHSDIDQVETELIFKRKKMMVE